MADSTIEEVIKASETLQKYADQLFVVANSIPLLNKVNESKVKELTKLIKEAVDFTGISVEAGKANGWDAESRVLTVKTVKGDKGDKGETGEVGPEGKQGSPGLQGEQGAQGEQGEVGPEGKVGSPGVGVRHIRKSATTNPEGKYGVCGYRDTFTMFGDANETHVIGSFDILNNNVVVDGEGSQLDADTVDGIEGNEIVVNVGKKGQVIEGGLVVDTKGAIDNGGSKTRPQTNKIGYQYFDTGLGQPIWFNGKDWVDSLGKKVK